MPNHGHHTPAQYACPTAVYMVLVTAGVKGMLLPFRTTTDIDAAYECAVNVDGIVVLLPVTSCLLPAPDKWSLD